MSDTLNEYRMRLKADARLRAAAPDLLEACELALLARDQFEGNPEGALDEIEHRLRGVIAKAKGTDGA